MARNSSPKKPKRPGQFVDLRPKLWAISDTRQIDFTVKPMMELSRSLGVDLEQAGIGEEGLNSYIRREGAAAPSNVNKSNALASFIKRAIPHLGNKSDDELIGQPFNELFKNTDLPEKFRSMKNCDPAHPTGASAIRWDVNHKKVNPGDVEVMARSAGFVNQKLMYHAPAAVKIWNSVTRDSQHGLYRICEDNLRKLLKTAEWTNSLPSVETVLILGAGAASKDKLILQSIEQPARQVQFVWVDASPHMLIDTVARLEDEIEKHSSNLTVAAIVTDFEDADLNRHFVKLGLSNEGIKATFILGFTLSNINEESFFRTFSNSCSEGDLLIFPMEFVPDDPSFPDNFKGRYSSNIAKDLAQAAFAIMPKATLSAAEILVDPILFNKSSGSYKLRYLTQVTDRHGDTYGVTTATATRHPRAVYMDFLKQQGFECIHSVESHGVETLLMKFAGRPV